MDYHEGNTSINNKSFESIKPANKNYINQIFLNKDERDIESKERKEKFQLISKTKEVENYYANYDDEIVLKVSCFICY